MTKKAYWWFAPDDGKTQFAHNGKRRKVKVGETLRIKGDPRLCERGLHASERLIDALGYAPGSLVCEVELGGTIVKDTDKVVAQERTVVRMVDATRTLHEFACDEAERALKARRKAGDEPDERSWNAIKVKRLWLDGKASDADLAAAWDAAWDAARDAAWAAAWAAAMAAARDAARAAARAAAWAAAWAAAGDAAGDAANRRLTRRVRKMLKEASRG